MNSEFYDKHLRDFLSATDFSPSDSIPLFGSLPELYRSFARTTGYEVKFVRSGGSFPEPQLETDASVCEDSLSSSDESSPVSTSCGTRIGVRKILSRKAVRKSDGTVLGALVLWQSEDIRPLVTEKVAQEAADSLAAVIEETCRAILALQDREAELAALACRFYLEPNESVNIKESAEKNENKIDKNLDQSAQSNTDELTGRSFELLRSILRDTARLVECQASALYLLDNDTSSLKLRCAWGIPEERFTEPPRTLKGSLADLEALLGNAVILNENYLAEVWHAPECFKTSVCVPVLSATAVLGTLWFFSDNKNDFSEKDLAILEFASKNLTTALQNILIKNELAHVKRVMKDNTKATLS